MRRVLLVTSRVAEVPIPNNFKIVVNILRFQPRPKVQCTIQRARDSNARLSPSRSCSRPPRGLPHKCDVYSTGANRIAGHLPFHNMSVIELPALSSDSVCRMSRDSRRVVECRLKCVVKYPVRCQNHHRRPPPGQLVTILTKSPAVRRTRVADGSTGVRF